MNSLSCQEHIFSPGLSHQLSLKTRIQITKSLKRFCVAWYKDKFFWTSCDCIPRFSLNGFLTYCQTRSKRLYHVLVEVDENFLVKKSGNFFPYWFEYNTQIYTLYTHTHMRLTITSFMRENLVVNTCNSLYI